jgi:hypothetical protein
MVMKRYGKSATGRIGTAAVLRALAVLIRRHPGAAFDMLGAGITEAGRSGVAELKDKFSPSGEAVQATGSASGNSTASEVAATESGSASAGEPRSDESN